MNSKLRGTTLAMTALMFFCVFPLFGQEAKSGGQDKADEALRGEIQKLQHQTGAQAVATQKKIQALQDQFTAKVAEDRLERERKANQERQQAADAEARRKTDEAKQREAAHNEIVTRWSLIGIEVMAVIVIVFLLYRQSRKRLVAEPPVVQPPVQESKPEPKPEPLVNPNLKELRRVCAERRTFIVPYTQTLTPNAEKGFMTTGEYQCEAVFDSASDEDISLQYPKVRVEGVSGLYRFDQILKILAALNTDTNTTTESRPN